MIVIISISSNCNELSCSLKQNELSSIREQLLQDFLPDDTCPLGTQFFVTPREIYQSGPKNDETSDTVRYTSFISRV